MKNLHEMHVTYQPMHRPSQTIKIKIKNAGFRNTKQIKINYNFFISNCRYLVHMEREKRSNIPQNAKKNSIIK
jgi:CTP synthase (UTP-ammonia lyase)